MICEKKSIRKKCILCKNHLVLPLALITQFKRTGTPVTKFQPNVKSAKIQKVEYVKIMKVKYLIHFEVLY